MIKIIPVILIYVSMHFAIIIIMIEAHLAQLVRLAIYVLCMCIGSMHFHYFSTSYGTMQHPEPISCFMRS